ncbi:MAG: hypothetical protein AAGC57_01155 [Pseudomonadota bacterium]
MTGDELSWAIAATLLSAALVGWVFHWIWCMLARATSSERERISHLVRDLGTAEDAREAAEARANAADTALAEGEAVLAKGLADAAADRDARIAEAEAAADTAVREAKAEAQTAWDGLAHARRRIADLEAQLG